MTKPIDARLQDNVAGVRQRIDAACRRSGRAAADVQLVAVTKYAAPKVIQSLIDGGTQVLGESRPQRLWELTEQITGGPEWHLIGHLQRNKVARTLPLVALVHSVDSERLLRSIDRESQALGTITDCLLEVNISGDAAKHGWPPDELPQALELAGECKSVKVKGLMAMAALAGGTERAAVDFSHMRELRDGLKANCPDEVNLDELSMGMSSDFEVAVEHGATLVRVGSALFEGM